MYSSIRAFLFANSDKFTIRTHSELEQMFEGDGSGRGLPGGDIKNNKKEYFISLCESS